MKNFDDTLKQLESIVSRMEKGELSLEDALKQFEEGVRLAKECQQTLRQAQERVQQLSIEA